LGEPPYRLSAFADIRSKNARMHEPKPVTLRCIEHAPGDNRPQRDKMDVADFAGFWLRHQRIGKRDI